MLIKIKIFLFSLTNGLVLYLYNVLCMVTLHINLQAIYRRILPETTKKYMLTISTLNINKIC